MKNFLRIFLFGILLVAIGACSDYQQIIKGTDYDEKFLEANRQYDKGSYSRAINLYEQVYQYYPRADKGELSYFRLGKCYYNDKDYYMAGYYFGQFTTRFPLSARAEEALFLRAICSVQNSPASSLDQQETDIALNNLQLFIQRYPESQYVDSCNSIMDRLRFKIETKEYNAVKLYDKMDEYRAAEASARAFLEDYPQSTFKKEVSLIHFDNAYVLAINSILRRKKERLEHAMELYTKYSPIFEKESYANRTRRYYDRLVKELSSVEEQYAYNEIVEAFEQTHTTSKQKKVTFLEETIKRFNNFAKLYPDSEYMERARNYFKRAEKELQNI